MNNKKDLFGAQVYNEELCNEDRDAETGLEDSTSENPKIQYQDPAFDYTSRTGRYLTLEERMQERRRAAQVDNNELF